MGLMKQAYDTYCTLEAKYCGVYGLEKEPLVPVSHQIAKAQVYLGVVEILFSSCLTFSPVSGKFQVLL